MWAGALANLSSWWLLAAAVAAFVLARRPRQVMVGIGIAAFAISALGVQLRALSHEQGEIDELLNANQIKVVVQVSGDPRKLRDRVIGQEFRAGQLSLPVRVEQVIAHESALDVRFAATLFIREEIDQVLPGECLAFTARGARFSDGRPLLRAVGPISRCGQASWLQQAAGSVRAGLRHASSALPEDARGLLPGLVVGDTTGTSLSLERAMREVNLAHLTAVSGANLAIVAAFVLLMARGVGLRRELIPIVIALAIAFFVVLARPDPSVLRAAVMALVLIVARILGSTHAAFTALAFAVITLVLANPQQASNPGFILSVSATAGLILWAKPISLRLSRHMPKALAVGLAVPIAAQLACTPFLVALSGQLSIIGVVANFLAAPLVPPATILGLIAGVIALWWGDLAVLIGYLAGVPVMGIAAIARSGGSLPFATLPMPSGAIGALLVALTTAAVCVGLRMWRRGTVAILSSCLLSILTLAWLQPGWPMRSWSLVVCDVGQGDGLVLRGSDNTTVVVDVGPDGRRMQECLRRIGVDRISLLFITHAHADHMEGLGLVTDSFDVEQVMLPLATDPPEQFERLLLMTEDQATRTVRAGDEFRWPGLHIQVLWPKRILQAGSVANNASTVLLATIEGRRILLLADIEREAQKALGAIGPVDVVKVAHHGSANHVEHLWDQWRPSLALISVGRENPYGHPAPQLLAALARRDIPVRRTDLSGALALSPEAGGWSVAARGAPFWAISR